MRELRGFGPRRHDTSMIRERERELREKRRNEERVVRMSTT
jgi:hypothetical protein